MRLRPFPNLENGTPAVHRHRDGRGFAVMTQDRRVLAADNSSALPSPFASSASAAAAPLVSLGALAAGLSLSLIAPAVHAQAAAQTTAPATETTAPAAQGTADAVRTLPAVSVKAKSEAQRPEAKTSYQAVTTNIGKGKQALRDIPQSITVVTEKLMDDRNLDDFKDVLRATGGISFLAGETGEEDVRLRGFSLSQAGDIYVDGLRDPSLYERDTFNHERVEVLKGSASMLFGRGSTGGVVNQVSKSPFLMTQHEVDVSIGTGDNVRVTGDFNFKTGDASAFRLNVMAQEADNDGVTISKRGVAPSFRWGIGEVNEFAVSAFYLDYDNNPIYNHRWFSIDGKAVLFMDNDAFYGLKSDYNKGTATYGTISHTHRLHGGGQIKTTVRHGTYERNLWATVISLCGPNNQGVPNANCPTVTSPITRPDQVNDSTVLNRTGKGRIAETDVTIAQSDFTKTFTALGMRHNVIAGVDYVKEDAKRNNNIAGPARPPTTIGTPNDGASIVDTRTNIPFNTFEASTFAVYGQNLLEITPEVKVLAGLRRDRFHGEYETAAGVRFNMVEWLTSHRLGAIFQPTEWASFHVAGGSSFNTSGDTYQFSPAGPNIKDARTPAEKSRNIEIGTKLDLFNNNLSVSASLFRTEKYNERNTDPDSAATQQLLSGKRHAKGLDVDIAGRITTGWDAFLSYTWIPVARIDESNVTTGNAQRKGNRPGLTPKHSASLWTTYQLTPKWRVGGGVNHRSEQSPQNNRTITVDGFTTFDLMTEYSISEDVKFKLNAANVTNRRYADGLYTGFYTPGAPRTITASLKVMF
jgi:catecholate siderophore receptor